MLFHSSESYYTTTEVPHLGKYAPKQRYNFLRKINVSYFYEIKSMSLPLSEKSENTLSVTNGKWGGVEVGDPRMCFHSS